MLILQREQRVLLAETLRDTANVAAGAMVFGQFFADQGFSPRVALLGLTVWACLVTLSLWLTKRKRA